MIDLTSLLKTLGIGNKVKAILSGGGINGVKLKMDDGSVITIEKEIRAAEPVESENILID